MQEILTVIREVDNLWFIWYNSHMAITDRRFSRRWLGSRKTWLNYTMPAERSWYNSHEVAIIHIVYQIQYTTTGSIRHLGHD